MRRSGQQVSLIPDLNHGWTLKIIAEHQIKRRKNILAQRRMLRVRNVEYMEEKVCLRHLF